jgi:hypothetical protein
MLSVASQYAVLFPDATSLNEFEWSGKKDARTSGKPHISLYFVLKKCGLSLQGRPHFIGGQ